MSDGDWYCVNTERGKEKRVTEILVARSIPTFLPGIAQRDQHRHSAIRPLFPSYMFIQLPTPEDWPRIQHTMFVQQIITHQPQDFEYRYPTAVPSLTINSLRAQIVSLDESSYPLDAFFQPIRPDCQVRITSGPFSHKFGICTASEQERVEVIVQMFNRSIIMEFLPGTLEVIQT